jgi:CSLREA domain-containing protein
MAKARVNAGYYKALVGLAILASLWVLAQAATPAQAESVKTYFVNTTGDQPDAGINTVCAADSVVGGSQCTLRAAIQEANATLEKDVIFFDIPQSSGDPNCTAATHVCTIFPASALPPITSPLTINGYSQPGSSPNTLTVGDDAAIKVELNGASLQRGTAVNGLNLLNTSDTIIRGLAIDRFPRNGISVSGDPSSGTTIANNNLIEGNFIGVGPFGTQDVGNDFNGVEVGKGVFNIVVGGTSPAARNVISGQRLQGLFIGEGSAGTRVQGNYVGTDRSGKVDLDNSTGGISIANAPTNTIGGTTAGAGNLISGNDDGGINVFASKNNKVLGNRIGTTASGKGALGNAFGGVSLFSGSSNNLIGDGTSAGSNTIAFNARDGVDITSSTSTSNEISRNSIFSNSGLGIDLIGPGESFLTNVSTPNDSGDIDTGVNNLQNKPVITSAKKLTRTRTVVKGRLNSTSGKTFTLRFFSNPSGNEGRKFLGEKSVTTDAKSGNVSFTYKPGARISKGQRITATSTDPAGNTSEFSAARRVVAT